MGFGGLKRLVRSTSWTQHETEATVDVDIEDRRSREGVSECSCCVEETRGAIAANDDAGLVVPLPLPLTLTLRIGAFSLAPHDDAMPLEFVVRQPLCRRRPTVKILLIVSFVDALVVCYGIASVDPI